MVTIFGDLDIGVIDLSESLALDMVVDFSSSRAVLLRFDVTLDIIVDFDGGEDLLAYNKSSQVIYGLIEVYILI